MAFSPDGKLLASGSRDTTILLWDVFEGWSAPATAEELDHCWAELGSPEASVGQAAVATLLRAPDRAVALARQRLRPVDAVDGGAIPKWVTELDSDRFETREKATARLAVAGERARSSLDQALTGNPTLELRRRVESLLKSLDGPVKAPDRLQRIRAAQLLEQVGNPEARAVLTRLGEGGPEEELTRDARAALERLAHRFGSE